ncbi:hypothetical protein CALVIDRAFT_47747 [Calocera viscosa TUFC12733]|uniref:BCS1 N-terminal domain-containing protein n=1 Tax=Calocera viscosa (strain TUFC12733) TaxID=1330018 RepID=A0A167FJH9_CALVF|nr:hypothetical protein CALVIDRAFT_47747 [Calocera viscosa TUFC12733]
MVPAALVERRCAAFLSLRTQPANYGSAQAKRKRNARIVDLSSGGPWESVSITTLSRDWALFDDILQEVYKMGSKAVENKTVIWSAWCAEWKPLGSPQRKGNWIM